MVTLGTSWHKTFTHGEMLHHGLRVDKLNVIVIVYKGYKPDRDDHKDVFFNLTWVKVLLMADGGTNSPVVRN